MSRFCQLKAHSRNDALALGHSVLHGTAMSHVSSSTRIAFSTTTGRTRATLAIRRRRRSPRLFTGRQASGPGPIEDQVAQALARGLARPSR